MYAFCTKPEPSYFDVSYQLGGQTKIVRVKNPNYRKNSRIYLLADVLDGEMRVVVTKTHPKDQFNRKKARAIAMARQGLGKFYKCFPVNEETSYAKQFMTIAHQVVEEVEACTRFKACNCKVD